ncbi:sensor histidine kinase [Methylomusa anaerophila]|uniref:histidine kinase n=1 Tax=Methylomusa anaerophila TaxID=1930071 RepID=A0A348AJJ1_9FIRM|nr:ATP-binding protein [Methylomusa anaerophila]BBB91239.1 alkaline phosphatase synthesis sensor protein PhoR [Methylomusa anaerophila]
MFASGLRNRLIIFFLALTILTSTLLGSYILWYFYRHNVTSLQTTFSSQAKIIQELLKEDMNDPIKMASIDGKIKELGTKLDNMRITIIAANGVVLADSHYNPAGLENHLQRPEVLEALAGGNGMQIRAGTTQTDNVLYVSTPIYRQNEIIGVVRISNSLSQVEEGYRKILSALLAASLLTFLVALAFSLALVNRYTKPLEQIIATANEIAEGHLDKRLFIRTGDELELLAHALNNLTSSLEDKVNDASAKNVKLELILQHMGDAVILLDRFGRVTTANSMAMTIFGITPQMLGQHNIQVIGNSLLDQAVQLTISKGESKLIDLKTNIHGKKRVFQVFIAPIPDNDAEITGILSVFHDITTIQELQDRQADFVTNASHELATPLTAIKGFAETLLDGALESQELAVKFVTIIHNEADRMHRLVQDLLHLAKLNAQEYSNQIKLEPVSVGPMLGMVKNDLMPRWQQKKQTVDIDCDCENTITLGNHDWLKQVIVNLVENSIKYTPEGGKISLTCWTDKENHRIKLCVKDTGIGIPAKDLPLIFDRFYRVDRARARSAGGTGLGLAIVKFIVEMLDGEIEVESAVDVGSTFTITLPGYENEAN